MFKRFPIAERRSVESIIQAITDTHLPTAVRPFMFRGKIAHELYFDNEKMWMLTNKEKLGAVASALIISCLAEQSQEKGGNGILDDQLVMTQSNIIMREAKRLKCDTEVSAFLKKVKALEDEWRAWNND
jgi:hypothetical protein